MKKKIEESDELKLMNYSYHKTGRLFYEDLFKKWLQKIPSDMLILELKRRKLTKIELNDKDKLVTKLR